MSGETMSLYDLLNVSISSPGQGTVNLRAMYALLHGMLTRLELQDTTVRFGDPIPAESAQEPGREEQREPRRRRSGEAPGPTQVDFLDERQVLELIQGIRENVEELCHRQDKASAAQAQCVKEMESYSHRVTTLEEAVKGPEEELYVPWETLKSALIPERHILKKYLIQSMKYEEQHFPDTSDPSKAQTEESRTEAKEGVVDSGRPTSVSCPASGPAPTSDPAPGSGSAPASILAVSSGPALDPAPSSGPAPGPAPASGPAPALKSLSQKVCKYQETVDPLRNMGWLKERCDRLEERLSALDLERSREQQELQRLRDLLHQRASEEALEALKEEMDEHKALVRSLQNDRDKSAQLVGGVQNALLHLQSECEKLHETIRCLHEDSQQKQTHIQGLYKRTEELEEKKADKNMVETEIRADKSALDSKVSRVQFDSVTEQLSNMFNELLSKVTDQEHDWSKVMGNLSAEMDCKLNRIERDSLKNQLESRWKSIQEQMKSEGVPEQDDAAAIRKQLVEGFHCLSCDRPVVKQIPGPQLLTLPSSPGFQPHRSLRPSTVYTLEQIKQDYRSERVLEVTDYNLYSVSRSCGGSHTLTSFNQRHRSALQHSPQQTRLLPQQLEDSLGQSEEVDIVGLDGHIYKGRLNSSLSRNAETKLPTIASKDGK